MYINILIMIKLEYDVLPFQNLFMCMKYMYMLDMRE